MAASTLFPVVCKARMTRSRLKPILVKKVTFSSDGGVRSIGGGRTSVSKITPKIKRENEKCGRE